MNNSQRTKVIAEGIAIYAALQNTNLARKEMAAWIKWCDYKTDKEIDFVKKAQFKLFDDCNVIDWSK